MIANKIEIVILFISQGNFDPTKKKKKLANKEKNKHKKHEAKLEA